ncbi:MAG TPA: PaaX family transcriptional regulator C-terminal domain-containing protein [bacterium]|nr:PaaX family transcriptional regulator C-terminal domain-containing protein [bacterium]
MYNDYITRSAASRDAVVTRLASARSLLVTVWGDTVRPRSGEIGAVTLIRLMAPLRLSPRAVRAALSRMTRRGWLSRRRTGRRAFYALTPAGALRLEQGVRRVYRTTAERWDGRWRLFTYVIPEERRAARDRLRRELQWLGLGPLSRSTWVTTRDLTEVLREMSAARGLDGAVALFDARNRGPADDRALVARCWDLNTIAARYRRFVTMARPRAAALRRRVRAGAISDDACFAEKIWLVHEYRKFLFVDPGLPDRLLPARRPDREAAALFRRTYALLAPRADRFVARVMGRGAVAR